MRVSHFVQAAAWVVAVGVLGAAPALAQQLTIVVRHAPVGSPGTLNQAVAYYLPGAHDSIPFPPPTVNLLHVAPGEQVCYRIQAANPLLYTYSLGASKVQVTPPSDLATVVAQLQKLIPASPLAAAAPGAPPLPEPGKEYHDHVRAVIHDDSLLVLLRVASDSAEDFRRVADSAAKLLKAAVGDSSRADSKTLSDDPGAAAWPVLLALTMQKVHALANAFDLARHQLEGTGSAVKVCKPMLETRTAFGLTVVADSTPPGEQKPARQTSQKDSSLAMVQVDPSDVGWFTAEPGVFFATAFAGAKDIGVHNGVLTVTNAHPTYVRPSLLAEGRVIGRIWTALGVAKSENTQVDYFVGMLLKSGDAANGLGINFGLGYVYANVPAGVINDAQSGEALPNGKTLKDVISYERRSGLGVLFTLSGLKISAPKF